MGQTISTKDQWANWATKLQALAQAGLYYTNNEFERERYREIRKIACEILKAHSSLKIDEIAEFFTCEKGYQTPKIDTRSVCFRDDKILLVKENSGLWSIPGGWVDVDLTISKNVIKEAKEEAGATVLPKFIIALHDWSTHVGKVFNNLPFQIVKIFVMCDLLDIDFHPNSETLEADFFAIDSLPQLAIGKNNLEQINLCFDAYNTIKSDKHWNAIFD